MKISLDGNVVVCFYYQERGTVTEPPPRATFSDNVNQWVIYDAYQEDFAKQVWALH